MQKILIGTLILAALASTSFAAPLKEFKFEYRDLSTQKIVFVTRTPSSNQEEAYRKSAMECFRVLRNQNYEGLDAIDICANPR